MLTFGGFTGLEELGAKHKKWLLALGNRIRSGSTSDKDLEEDKQKVQSGLDELADKEISDAVKKNAEEEVKKLLIHNGSIKAQADRVAKDITKFLFSDAE